MTRQVGARVGAMLGARDKTVRFLGYGVYQGDEVPPENIGGFNMGFPNPKIVLDNGKVVWGCECWWGAEDQDTHRTLLQAPWRHHVQRSSVLAPCGARHSGFGPGWVPRRISHRRQRGRTPPHVSDHPASGSRS